MDPSGFEGGRQAEAFRVWLLGGFRVGVGSRTTTQEAWRLRKASALVKLLALAPGHRLHREQLIDLLWPDSSRRTASNSLRKALHVARGILDPEAGSRYLASQDESLVLCPSGDLWVDVDAFEKAVSAARRSREPAAYRAALELYAGDLLPEDRYEDWAEEKREQLRWLRLNLLVELAALYEGYEQYGPAVEVLRKAIAEEPTNEAAHLGLMRTYALLGRRAEALAQFERLEEALSTHLGAEPGAETTNLRGELVAGTFPPARAQPSAQPSEQPLGEARHNLPAPRDSFVGRERELGEVNRELAMTRLLTLTGAGGSGKTRLALEVARDLVGAYPDGVWLVELAGLSDLDLLPQAVASTLGVQERPDQPLSDTLVDVLRAKQELLVLDNCEHLVEAAARLADALLDGCPRLRILATSREPLGVQGETTWMVPSLPVPGPQQAPTVGELEGYEAARLFAERASCRRPGFALVPANALAVAEICRKLEGLPLAIELAAGRVGALTVDQISKKLENSLGLLTSGARTAGPRQRTLRGALDWSYDLLSGPERKAFRRLSVFAGGWTLKASEAVASSDDIEEAGVLDILTGLAEKSLVVADASGEGGVRYRLLEPVRQFASEKLEESGEAQATRYRHSFFFLVLAEEADPKLEGPDQPRWLDHLEEEHDNIRAALSWLLQRDEGVEMALRMVAALGEFWYLRGDLGEGRRWLEGALATPGLPSATRARAMQRVSWLAILQGDNDRAVGASEEGLGLEGVDLFRTGGGDSTAADLRRTLGLALSQRGDLEQAMNLLEESLAMSREVGSVRGTAVSLFCLGGTWNARGDDGRALRFLEEALALMREVGDPSMIASISTHLGYTLLLEGDIDRAKAVSEEAEMMLREQKNRLYLAYVLDNIGWAALLESHTERAQASFAESLELLQEISAKESVPGTLERLASVAVTQGEARRAARLFGAARALRQAMSVQQEPGEHALEEPHFSAARARLDEVSWDAAFAEGKAMSMEAAVEYALSEEPPTTPVPALSHQPSADEVPTLSRREEEIAVLVAHGLTNRQVATELSISEHTAATHVGRILKKLEFHSRTELATWVAERSPTSHLN